jgi:hypothetical protein
MTDPVIERIERDIALCEAQAGKIDGDYLYAVEKVAQRANDEVAAGFIRKTMLPAEIRREIEGIRFHLRFGDIAAAETQLRLLKRNLEYVEGLVAQHFAQAGFRSSRGASAGGNRDRGNAARNRKMRAEFADALEAERQKTNAAARRSESEIIKAIGARHDLKFSAAYEAIKDRKKVSG